MTKINCSVECCGYNDCRVCKKTKVDIEGLFAKSRIGTFCQSFQNPRESDVLKTEMAKEMTVEDNTSILCTANYCVHNSDNRCSAKEIKVGNDQAKFRSETQCNSFKLK